MRQDPTGEHQERDAFDAVVRRMFARRREVADPAEIDGQIASLLMRWIEARLEAQDVTDLPDALVQPGEEAQSERSDGPFRAVTAPIAELLRVVAERYAAAYDGRPDALWALANELVVRRCLRREVRRDELATLKRLATRAMRAVSTPVEPHDARFALVLAMLLGLRHRDAAARETHRRRIHELTHQVIAEVGVYDVQAFSHRRVLRRLARWLPAEDGDARRIAAELYEALGALGVASVWRER
jgi:hypothetical protein